jgi:hypothetical protein
LNGAHWLPSRTNFFLPVKALSKLFRARFQALLRKSPLFSQIPNKVWFQDWVVHCLPVGDGQAALKYLAPYIYRVAISNRRLINFIDKGSLEKSQVTFEYRQSDTGQVKHCTLSVEQFIQRFLQHVLPKGFVKVRYFGFFAHNRRASLASLKNLLVNEARLSASAAQVEAQASTTASPKFLCPVCGTPMNFTHHLAPVAAPHPVARSP